jgi:2-haloalkanoic acid dehalogenase type II
VAPRAVLLDLLMATMNSIATWTAAAGDRDGGLAWRDAVTARMIDAGRYVAYEGLVRRAAADLGLPPHAPAALDEAWALMRPWPDTVALEDFGIGYAFVTNCSNQLAAVAVERSGLRPMFTLSAEEAGWFKPRREIYALAVERLGLEASQVQFVAGAAYDAIGASKAGLSTVLVARRRLRERLPKPIRVVESLGQALEGMVRGPA